ncbi:hypothetical protein FKW77_003323 [Venturia effusa]|uniref:Protein kinase domain-containing protein n=1 Tax=Venturia effusa TaxID=50376 RepID=A0A517L2Y2_9PEZI|nr:hypothetical protein FKW77_003323 [Venturia effusa]
MADPSNDPAKLEAVEKVAEQHGIVPSRNISLDVSDTVPKDASRPPAIKHMSTPTYQSPLRHHTRLPSHTNKRRVKETLNARSEYSNSEDDGTAEHRINQYLIKDEIGRGSFGAVHLAVDQFGDEYAVKEFSKSRLRKRAQSNLLRRSNGPRLPGHYVAGKGFNSPLHRAESGKPSNSLDLIREEIAIMKKLSHPNVVSLVEVLDDPEEDSLYMVMEMCKKGVVMKVGLDTKADPYDEERCRHWFRDMILGMEYLHAQGIIHRDVKPDNCLITADDVLKFVDFGVSEMFEKDSDMNTAKSAGSPAFMPPELCVAKHGEVSGRAADIWSMGVTLYCLRYGAIPFEKTQLLDLYEAIKTDEVDLGQSCPPDFEDLMTRLLKKNPHERITMEELRDHPWVTKGGTDPLLSKEENTAHLVEPPTEEELDNAITGNMGHLMVVMKAVKRFKQLLVRRRPELMEGIFGRASKFVQPPLSMNPMHRTKSDNTANRIHTEQALTVEGVHREFTVAEDLERLPKGVNAEKEISQLKDFDQQGTTPGEQMLDHIDTGKGQAHDPLEDILLLGIGPGGSDMALDEGEFSAVSESPGAVEGNIYEMAYQEELERIVARQESRKPTIYLTRRVENSKKVRALDHIADMRSLPFGLSSKISSGLSSSSGFKKLVEDAKAKVDDAKTKAGEVKDSVISSKSAEET